MTRTRKAFLLIGLLLLMGSLGLLLFTHLRSSRAEQENAAAVAAIRQILPESAAGVQDSYSTMEMPALEIGGEDYIALLDFPALDLTLPVALHWDSSAAARRPCRFLGTAYDGSLVIGGSDSPGQFDFFDRVPTGMTVTVTDMTGRVFSYTVDRVERSSSAGAELLADGSAELTLFVRSARSLEYLILRCTAK